jgi:beta-galactosidase
MKKVIRYFLLLIGSFQLISCEDWLTVYPVLGNAKLYAVDNGDHTSDELFDGNKRQLFNGFAMAILRSTQTAGEVEIRANVPGLKSAGMVLVTK